MTETLISKPIVTGNYQIGDTISASTGQWHFDLDYGTYEYQWLRCDANGQNCIDIPGATGASYKLTSADKGHKLRVRVTASEHTDTTTPPPPPGPTTAYTVEDFSDIRNPPYESIHTFQCPGWQNPVTPVQKSIDGRVAIVAAPDGVGKAFRFEIRDSDAGWCIDTSTARSQLMMTTQATWNAGSYTPGEIRWFDQEWWMPLGEFDYPRNDWFTLVGLHPNGAYNGWGCFDIGFDGNRNHPAYMTFKLAGGSPGSTANLTYPRLWQITNADGSWYTPNFNRRIKLQYGGKFNPDNTGWFEAWVDGANVVPRMSHPTTWQNDYSTYFKIGPYKKKTDPFPVTGKTVIYCTKLTIGKDRPF